MNFSELYINNKLDAERRFASLWGSEANNEGQRAHVEQLKSKISNLFAPDTAIPVVQCMNSYKSVHSVSADDAKKLVGKLWTSKFDPYEHQYQCWNTLLKENFEGKPMSICVTTGTGSGKTECFMMPLVQDLVEYNATHDVEGQIQALFLYPLNALMEDQKERLEKMLAGTGIKYTVYNGDLPEKEPSPRDQTEEAEKVRRKIAQIRGQYIDEETGEVKYKYPNMVYTRTAVRQCPPSIVLTNPTMLEYILLRKTDEKMMDPEKQSLRWVAIDETHTYTGAGAAELAMLLRRVMIAFGKDAKDVRFATSSATFANADPNEPAEVRRAKELEGENKLKEFISDLTGTAFGQVKVVGGVREGEELLPTANIPAEDKTRWAKICNEDFVSLDALFAEGDIAGKLAQLDEMCHRIEALKVNDDDKLLMKTKVHYFYRVPNNGLYVRLNEHEDGAFIIKTEKPVKPEDDKLPLLELNRCKNCGEFVAVGLLDKKEHKLYPIDSDDSDMFDLGLDDDEESDIKQIVFALTNKGISDESHTGIYEIEGNKVMPANSVKYRANAWHLIGNEYKECPCCRTKLTRYAADKKKDDNSDAEVNPQDMRLQKLRLSSEFISRILAPSILDQLEEGRSEKNRITLHRGQQFLSFVDSRQAAAKSTMNQNLEQERLWFYSTIFHELCRRNTGKITKDELLAAQWTIINDVSASPDKKMAAFTLIQRLQNADDATLAAILNENAGSNILTWNEIADLLYNDEKFIVFCQQFVKRNEDSEDIDPVTGNIHEFAKKKYLYSIMVLYLGNHPASAASPETMGLFHPVYPFLDDVKAPASINAYNALIAKEENKIGDKDWQNLIQVFIDYTVRSNQSFFLNMPNEPLYDIFSTERYATEKPRRRPVTKPKYEKKGDVSDSRIVRYLSGLIGRDRGLADDSQIQKDYFNEIYAVVNDLWKELTTSILEVGTHYDDNAKKQVDDADATALRLNLAKMCFKLYDEAWLCDTNTDSKEGHVARLRPVEVIFKQFSPYLIGNRAVTLNKDWKETYAPYTPVNTDNPKADFDNLQVWAKENRSNLWANDIWGDNGLFADRLNSIYLKPDLFIQAEHTAQVDKSVARTLQSEFKDHTINILACSTTMEMGVDLGNLEVVMLTSVPPQPSNYKQRAGRSGRNNKVKSVCITLCGSDAIGLRTLTKPIETIISRPVDVPTVDLDSRQVVMRHVNSYLIRTFGVFASGSNGGSLQQKVLDFYTPFETQKAKGDYPRYYNNGNEIGVADGLGDKTNTKYMEFAEACGKPMTPEMKKQLSVLLKKTPFASNPADVLTIAAKENDRCYNELSKKVEGIKQALRDADKNSKGYASYLVLLKMEYLEVLAKQKLLNYWATNRFTPNANMPVNVMSLDLNPSNMGKKKEYKKRGSSNPSYTLREAIQQYVPGNSIVVDGVVYVVRGLSTSDEYTDQRTFKQLYRNANKTIVGNDPTLDSRIPWNVNGLENLTLVQPAKFLPDPNEEYSRAVEDNLYTKVSSQLIGTNDWENRVTEPHLFSTRRNMNSGNANILYYNEGIGYGYAMCTKCGKMTLEYGQVDDRQAMTPREINDRKNSKGQWFHYAINREPKCHCFGSNDKALVKRNVIIGDLMQTDYCEIRLRHKGDTSWINFSPNKEIDDKNVNLLFTLGIVFCQALVELKGWERNSVDFAVMQNRHLCIFDTNPGGAGYSIKLHENQTMLDVISGAKKLLNIAKDKDSKDMLLDKFTLRFLRHIDIQAALDWIEEQEQTKGIMPDPIPTLFAGKEVQASSLRELKKSFAASSKPSTLFVDNNYQEWEYGTANVGWQSRFLGDFFDRRGTTTFCVAEKCDLNAPEPIIQMARDIKAIFGNPKHVDYMPGKEIYPLAYIDGHLYFTINRENSTFNECWGDGVLYCVKTDNPAESAKDIDCSVKANTKIFQLSTSSIDTIQSRDLGKHIHENAREIIDAFVSHCKSVSEEPVFVYKDEHLKSVLGMVISMQTIEYFARLIGKDFEVSFLMEKYFDNSNRRGIMANIATNTDRDDKLEELCRAWLDKLDQEAGIYGTCSEIKSVEARSLTHWRELSITCGGKKLVIYPDGGFANGWHIASNNSHAVSYKYYDENNTTTDDNITIKLNQDIKFDVNVENC